MGVEGWLEGSRDVFEECKHGKLNAKGLVESERRHTTSFNMHASCYFVVIQSVTWMIAVQEKSFFLFLHARY